MTMDECMGGRLRRLNRKGRRRRNGAGWTIRAVVRLIGILVVLFCSPVGAAPVAQAEAPTTAAAGAAVASPVADTIVASVTSIATRTSPSVSSTTTRIPGTVVTDSPLVKTTKL